jgi:AraC-like DNA-binding protein
MNSRIDTLPTPSTYTRILLQRWPDQSEALLEGTGLVAATLPTQATINVVQQLQVFRNAKHLTDRPDWALDFGRQLNTNSHGPLGFAAVSAPTLGEGIDVLGRFARIRAPYLSFDTCETERHVMLKFDANSYPLGDLELPMIEIILQVALAYVDAAMGGGIVETVICIKPPAPDHLPLYPQYFRSHCEFDADFNGIALPVSLKGLPCPLHDEKVYHASLQRCREALDAVLSPEDVVARASHWLAAHFDQIAAHRKTATQPRLEQLATALCMSPRTLIRQLAEQGTSFTELRSAQQLEMACKMLNDASYQVAEIGFFLGYGDAANFGRAFRRMTGLSPGQFRRNDR